MATARAMIADFARTSQVDGHLMPGLSMTRLHWTERRGGRVWKRWTGVIPRWNRGNGREPMGGDTASTVARQQRPDVDDVEITLMLGTGASLITKAHGLANLSTKAEI